MCSFIWTCFKFSLLLFFTVFTAFTGFALFAPSLNEGHFNPQVPSTYANLDKIVTYKNYSLDYEIYLSVLEAGDKSSDKILLFLHGFPETAATTYHSQINYFHDKGYHIVAPNMRGYNQSSAPYHWSSYHMDTLVEDIDILLEKHINPGNKKKVYLIAHDWGGAIGWRLMMKREYLFEKYVALNMPHVLSYFPPSLKQSLKSWYFLFFNLYEDYVHYILEHNNYSNLLRTLETTKPQAMSLKEINDLRKMYKETGCLRTMLHYYRAMVRMIFKTKIDKEHKIDKPVLLLFGTDDIALDVSSARKSEKFCNKFKLKEFEGVSHFITHDIPDIVNKEIEAFVKE